MLTRATQMFAFPLSSLSGLPWKNQSNMSLVSWVLSSLSTVDVSASTQFVLFGLSIGWIAVLFALCTVVAMAYTRNRFSNSVPVAVINFSRVGWRAVVVAAWGEAREPEWPHEAVRLSILQLQTAVVCLRVSCRCVQALRNMIRLSLSVFLIPIIMSLTRVYSCERGSTWLTTSMQCFVGVHVFVTVLATLLLIPFCVVALGGKSPCRLCHVECLMVPSKRHAAAAELPHSVDALHLIQL